MANTVRINTKSVSTKHINTKEAKHSSNTYNINNSVEKLKICQIFTRLIYTSVIIGAVLYLITLIVLFGASVNNPNHTWFGFWIQHTNIEQENVPTPTLSAFAITTIVFDCLWLMLFTTHMIGNLILNNKIELTYVTKISIVLCVSIILMISLGSCSKPIYAADATKMVFYISWMRLIKVTSSYWSTVLTSGAIFILLEMIFIYLGCIAYIAYYYISRAKKKK